MRTFLPIVWLLARVVLGTVEIENNFSDVARSRTERDDRLENETEKFGPTTNDLYRDSSGDSFAMEADQKEADPGGVIKDESNAKLADFLKIIIKRGQDSAESLLDQNEKSSAQEKKNPWAFWWGGKRINTSGQNSGIRRPIRVPFDSWGGKRGRPPFNNWGGKRGRLEFKDWGGKRGKVAFGGWGGKRGRETNSEFNQIDSTIVEPDEFTDNLKRAENDWWCQQPPYYSYDGKRRKACFYNWGGKRSQSGNDRESGEDGDQDDRENSPRIHHMLGVMADEFPKEDKTGRFQIGQSTIRGEIEMAAVDDGSDGKRNNVAYRIPTENIDNWFAQMYRLLANRKAQRGHTKAVSFLPWYGKRTDSDFSPWGG
nr:uncharacterized protein LOC117224140 [Megalopta genalis]